MFTNDHNLIVVAEDELHTIRQGVLKYLILFIEMLLNNIGSKYKIRYNNSFKNVPKFKNLKIFTNGILDTKNTMLTAGELNDISKVLLTVCGNTFYDYKTSSSPTFKDICFAVRHCREMIINIGLHIHDHETIRYVQSSIINFKKGLGKFRY